MDHEAKNKNIFLYLKAYVPFGSKFCIMAKTGSKDFISCHILKEIFRQMAFRSSSAQVKEINYVNVCK